MSLKGQESTKEVNNMSKFLSKYKNEEFTEKKRAGEDFDKD